MEEDINNLKETHPHIHILVKGYCIWLILYVLFQHLRLSKVRQSRQLPNSRPLNNLPSRVEITREILRELEWNNSWFSFYENIFHTLRAYIYLTVCDRTANKRLTNITYIQLISWKKFFRLSNLFFVVYHFSAFCKKRKSIFRRRVRIKNSVDFIHNFNLFQFECFWNDDFI